MEGEAFSEKLSDRPKVTKLPGVTVGTDSQARWTVLYLMPGVTSRPVSQTHPPCLCLLGAVEERTLNLSAGAGWGQDGKQ